MTKRDGEIIGKYDRIGNSARRSPSRSEYSPQDVDSSPSPQNHRHSIGSHQSDGNFCVYRDSRSAPNSVPGSAAGSRANSRPGSRAGSRMHSRCNSAESIIDLFDSMTIKYGQNLEGYGSLETPKPARFVNTRISYVDRVRINSAVWRSWHMQYVKKKKSIVCSFALPFPNSSIRLQSDVIQGKTALTGYKPEELGAVVRNYNKWRLFSRDILTQRPMPPLAEDNAIDLSSPHPPLSPGTGGKLTNDDLFKDVADTLFISRKKKLFKAPAPKKVTHMLNYNPDYLQPDLSTMLSEVDDDFMEAITSVQAILCKTPTKSDPRSMGLMEDLPSNFFSSENFNAFFATDDIEPWTPQVVTAGQQSYPNFLQDQSPVAPCPQKSVSFSAPTTPSNSAASSPGFQVQSPYDFVGSLQSFEHGTHIGQGIPQQQQQQMHNQQCTFTNANFVQNNHHPPTSQVISQHPTLLETLQNAPGLPTHPRNMINTVVSSGGGGVSSPGSLIQHSLSGASSPGESLSSTSGPMTPETKLEPTSPSSQACTGPTLVYTQPSTTVVGNLCYQVSDLTAPIGQHTALIGQHWDPTVDMSGIGPPGQLLSLGPLGDLGGPQSITVQGGRVISQGPIYPRDEEMVDLSQGAQKATGLPGHQRNGSVGSNSVFKLPAHGAGDVQMSPRSKSPKSNNKQRSAPLHADSFQAAFTRKKSTGGPDDHERHAMTIPHSRHTSNASSAASSPGNEDSGKDFETCYHNSKKRGNTDLADRDDRAMRRKRKHLDSEHKRRYNIQTGLDELTRILPSIKNSVAVGSSKDPKISTALLLQRAQEHICSLNKEIEQLSEEKKKMHAEVDQLNDDIEKCQDALPDTGAPSNSQNDNLLKQMLEEYIAEEMEKEWKYWMFSKFARPLFTSFLSAVKVSTLSSIDADLTTWFEESCRLRQLRSLALLPVRQISKETSILTDPSKLPEQVKELIRQETGTGV